MARGKPRSQALCPLLRQGNGYQQQSRHDFLYDKLLTSSFRETRVIEYFMVKVIGFSLRYSLMN